MKSLRILEYITASSLGGAEHVVRAVGSELIRRGHDLLFVSPKGRLLTPVLRKEGFSVWAPRTYGKVDPVTLLRVARVIRSRRIQIVHTHLSTASLLGSLAARLCGVPAVATAHGLNTAFTYRFATRIVAVSDAVREHLVRQGIPAERIQVVRNGIDVEHFAALPDREAARAAFGARSNDRVLLYTGHLTVDKGANLLLPIMDQLRERVPGARLIIVGDGEMRSELQNEIERRSLDGQIFLMGFKTDIRPFLAAADLVLLPSLKEGLGMVLLEAMAARLPAVATNVGGIPEVIEPGVTGEMVPPGNVSAFAAACASILEDGTKYGCMAAAATARVRERFSIQRSVSELEGVFAEAIRTPKSSGADLPAR